MHMAGRPPVRHDAGCLHMGRSCIVVRIFTWVHDYEALLERLDALISP